ncbi:MAG: hypothetical protein RL260_3135 [Pseudomonadota bacterium]|jgi:hypothetical protein
MHKELGKEATPGSSRAERDPEGSSLQVSRSKPSRAQTEHADHSDIRGREKATCSDLKSDHLGVIVANDRDRRSLAWLVQQVGPQAVAEAVTRLSGLRRPYATNVAAVLGLTLPRVVALAAADSPNRLALAAKLTTLRGKHCDRGFQHKP